MDNIDWEKQSTYFFLFKRGEFAKKMRIEGYLQLLFCDSKVLLYTVHKNPVEENPSQRNLLCINGVGSGNTMYLHGDSSGRVWNSCSHCISFNSEILDDTKTE